MSDMMLLSDAELDAVAGGWGFTFQKNVAIVPVVQTNASLVNILAVQSNAAAVEIDQSNET